MQTFWLSFISLFLSRLPFCNIVEGNTSSLIIFTYMVSLELLFQTEDENLDHEEPLMLHRNAEASSCQTVDSGQSSVVLNCTTDEGSTGFGLTENICSKVCSL